jgi:LacI family transcriptional regulator, galactose operon repressor
MKPAQGNGKGPARDLKRRGKRVTLKVVAEHVGLSPATVSVVLNRSPVADAIPPETKERVFAAARELRYRPNLVARSLRGKRSFLVGVLVPELSEGYASGVMSGVEARLIDEGYFYLIASHRSRFDLLEEYLNHLQDRSVEGFILLAAHLTEAPQLPTVVVSGHRRLESVTNVVVNHDLAVKLALEHLVELGHRRIAFFRGADGNIDADDRWRAIEETAASLELEICPQLAPQLVGRSYGPVFSPEEGYQEGYAYGRKLLAAGNGGRARRRGTKPSFTALFAFNDVSAIGAMRAFLDAGLRVPEDVSVIGFDDILGAAFQNPSLTTIKQPLEEMGKMAGSILLRRLGGKNSQPDFVTVEPELVVRASTGPARAAG